MLKRFDNKELNNIIDEFLCDVAENFNINKAVLFGSYAKGKATELSDIDILIVSSDLPRQSTKGMNGYRILSKLKNIYPSIEVIGSHPDSLNNEITKAFFDEILKDGRILL